MDRAAIGIGLLAVMLALGCSGDDDTGGNTPGGDAGPDGDGSLSSGGPGSSGDGSGTAAGTGAGAANGGSGTAGAQSGASDGGLVGDGGSAMGGSGSGSQPLTDAGSSNPTPVVTPTPEDEELETVSGCAGVYNPDQLLKLSLELAAGDWNTVLADTSYSVVVEAQMQCEDEPPLTVGVRRKRSGGNQKVGLKIDINAIVPGQEWYGLKKLSLENGVSSGDNTDGADVGAYLAEYLSWRMMVLSGAVTSRAAFVQVEINGEPLGVYVDVEQPDKRFLEARLGDDSGWLYKKSGGVDDGLKTNELSSEQNPYEEYFCFWASGKGCAIPSASELLAELPERLDIPQFLRVGAVNAFIANGDGPLFKDNNYYYYDYASGPRVYLPWDLDTTMNDDPGVYMGGGGGGGTSDFDAVLFMHWRDDYTAIVQELLDEKLTRDVIDDELDRAVRVAGEALDDDSYVSGSTADAAESLDAYWTQRLADIQAELQ